MDGIRLKSCFNQFSARISRRTGARPAANKAVAAATHDDGRGINDIAQAIERWLNEGGAEGHVRADKRDR